MCGKTIFKNGFVFLFGGAMREEPNIVFKKKKLIGNLFYFQERKWLNLESSEVHTGLLFRFFFQNHMH